MSEQQAKPEAPKDETDADYTAQVMRGLRTHGLGGEQVVRAAVKLAEAALEYAAAERQARERAEKHMQDLLSDPLTRTHDRMLLQAQGLIPGCCAHATRPRRG